MRLSDGILHSAFLPSFVPFFRGVRKKVQIIRYGDHELHIMMKNKQPAAIVGRKRQQQRNKAQIKQLLILTCISIYPGPGLVNLFIGRRII
jgi:hypothetical protein